MATYLDAILAAHRQRVADDPRSVEALIDQAKAIDGCRGFAAAIRAADASA